MLSIRGTVVGAVLLAITLFAPATAGAVKTSPGQVACNGSSLLCDRQLNDVVVPGTHNSMGAKDLGWFNPNQTYDIPKQLELGVRSFLIDTYYGEPQPNGQVRNLLEADGKAAGAPLYLCHSSCLFGASPLVPELRKVADFLEANPHEVLNFVNQDAVDPVDFGEAVEESGLIDHVYTGPTGPWPTLGEMIAGNQRVVMLAESDATGVPWYHRAYGGPMRETPYSFNNDSSLLTAPDKLNDSCGPLRGEEQAGDDSLFLMNHWISTTGDSFEPNIEYARIVNQKDVLVKRARACEQRRGFLPNVLSVDFFGTGDVVGAANELNGVPASASLRTNKVKRAKVKAGKRAVIKVPVTNGGDASANSIRVCAKVPRKLASKPACQRLDELLSGSRATFKLKLKTSKKSRGSGTVKIKVNSSAGAYTVKAKLKVKPAPRKRRA